MGRRQKTVAGGWNARGLQFGGLDSKDFAKHFSTVKSGRRTVMKSLKEFAHKYGIITGKPNIWDQAF